MAASASALIARYWRALPVGVLLLALPSFAEVSRTSEEEALAYLERIAPSSAAADAPAARSSQQIQEVVGAYVRRYYDAHPEAFWGALSARLHQQNERALRLLLDLLHYFDRHTDVICAEATETLRDQIIPFFDAAPETVLAVAQDPEQKSRERIRSAWIMFIDPLGPAGLDELRSQWPALAELERRLDSLD
jgi:hypothetical protein